MVFVCLVCCGLSRLWLVSVAVWVATPVAQTAAFVVQMAGPAAGNGLWSGRFVSVGDRSVFKKKAASFCERPV